VLFRPEEIHVRSAKSPFIMRAPESLCGITNWQTGVAQEISGSQFKDGGEPESGSSFNALFAVTNNGTSRYV